MRGPGGRWELAGQSSVVHKLHSLPMVKEISWWIRARKRSYCANVDFFGLFWHLFVCIPYISTQKSDNFTTDLLLFIAHRGELSFLFYLAAFPASQDWFEPVCAYQLSALIIIFFLNFIDVLLFPVKLYQQEMSLLVILGMRLNNQLHVLCI